MPYQFAERTTEVQAVRAALCEGLTDKHAVAAALDVSPRTVNRWISRRLLEVVCIGNKQFIKVQSLQATAGRPPAPVRRGRPRKVAA